MSDLYKFRCRCYGTREDVKFNECLKDDRCAARTTRKDGICKSCKAHGGRKVLAKRNYIQKFLSGQRYLRSVKVAESVV